MANGLQVDFLLAGVMGTNNKPLAEGLVYCYGAGGSTLTPVYTDATLLSAAANPVVLDERGSANVYASGNYKFVIKDKNGTTIETYDNLYYVVPETEATDVVTTATAYTATTNPEVISANTGSGAVAVTLPSASGNEGLRKTLFKSSADGNAASFTPDGAETINGAASWSTTTQYGFAEIISDGTNWILVNSNVSTGVVTTTSSDTLTNKSLSDSTTYIIDNVDNTKKLQFQVSGVTTGTTRTLTVPDASDTIVGKATTDTLTNKTLTTPVIVSFYQDAGKTKLMTTPNTASDTLCAIAATQTLTNKTLTAPVLGGTVTGTYTLGGTPTITTPTITVAAWQTPSFENSWGNGSSTYCEVRYRKDPMGNVYLLGTAAHSGASSATIFTLAEGYRPEMVGASASKLLFTCIAGPSGNTAIIITSAGAVSCLVGDSAAYFDGIVFKAA